MPDDKDIAERRDDIVRRMLATPPKPKIKKASTARVPEPSNANAPVAPPGTEKPAS